MITVTQSGTPIFDELLAELMLAADLDDLGEAKPDEQVTIATSDSSV